MNIPACQPALLRLLTLIAVFLPWAAYAAEGDLDTTFNSTGKILTTIGTGISTDSGRSVAMQSDGKIVVGGYSVAANNYKSFALVRYNANGSLDTALGGTGKVTTAIGSYDASGSGIVVQGDQKIIVAGTAAGFDGDFAVVRYNTDGTLDSSFGGGKVTTDFGSNVEGFYTYTDEVGRAVALQSDGKIIVAGETFDPYVDNGSHFAVVRYNTGGTLDTSFGGTGKVKTSFSNNLDGAYGVAIQSDQKIVVAGYAYNEVSQNDDFAVARFNTNGSLDTTFGGTGKVMTAIGTVTATSGSGTDVAHSVAIQKDGKIVVSGFATNGGNVDFAVVRYNTDGSLDTSFGGTGKVTTDFGGLGDNIFSMVLQGDGKILVAGQSRDSDFAVVRYNTNGTLDTTFHGTGKVTTDLGGVDQANGMTLQSDGKIVVTGISYYPATTDIHYLAMARYVGSNPQIAVEEPAGTSLVSGTTSIDFGTTTLGSNVTKTFTVKSMGSTNLSLSGVTKDGLNSGDFIISAPLAASVAPGGHTTFTVAFSPTVAASRAAAIHIASSDSRASPFDIALTGTGATPTAPAFLVPPGSGIVMVGQPVTLTGPPVLGDTPQTYQWRKGTASILTATGIDLTIASVKTTDAALYSLHATNVDGSATSASATLAVVTPGTAAVSVNAGATLSLTCTVTAPAGTPLAYSWSRAATPLSNGGRVTGADTKALKITGLLPTEAGAYSCTVTMTTPGGPLTATNGSTTVTVVQVPAITAFTIADASVSQSINLQIPSSNFPTHFTVTGLPPGMVLNAITGLLTGKPTVAKLALGVPIAYPLHVSCSNSAGVSPVIVVNWIIQPLPASAIGTSTGLVDRDPLNAGLGGTIKVITTSTGALTGTLKLGAKSYALAGKLDASIGADPAATITIAQTPASASLTVNLTDFNLTTGKVTGSVHNSTSANVAITAWRSPWSLVNKASAYAGNYTAALDLPSLALHDPLYPQGHGYATLNVGSTGLCTWGGKLADGSAISGGVTLGPDGEVPLQVVLYATPGSAQGWQTITSATGYLDGTLDWYKPQQAAATRSYHDGILLHTQTLVGGLYPATAVNLPTMLGLALPLSMLNTKLSFSDGGLTANFDQLLTVTATNTSSVPTSPSLNSFLVKLTLTPSTGLFSGSFSRQDADPTDLTSPITVITRAPPFYGVLVPRLAQGVGFFLLNELPASSPTLTTAANSPTLSGQVILKTGP